MKLHTVRTRIRGVAARWREQYRHLGPGDKIGRQLEALDVETATAEDARRIIGNDSWTRLTCEQCEGEVAALVTVGNGEDGYRQLDLCEACLRSALALIEGAKGATPCAR